MRFVRAFTVFLFYLSQLFTPLVHAHVGVDLSPAAIHLPGLEAAVHQGLNGSVSLEDRDGLVVQAAKGIRSGTPAFPPGAMVFPAGSIPPGLSSARRASPPPVVPFSGHRRPPPPPSRAPPVWR